MNHAALSVFDKLADSEKSRLTGQFTQKHKEVTAVNEQFRKSIIRWRELKWHTHDSIWSPCLFSNTTYYDLSILVELIAFERDEWRRRFFARSLAIVIYEIGEDLPTVFGKTYRDACLRLAVPRALMDQLNSALKSISTAWNRSHGLLRDIRLISGAHRDHDPILLNETIARIDAGELFDLGMEFGRHMHTLGAAAQEIVNYTSACMPPEIPAQSQRNEP